MHPKPAVVFALFTALTLSVVGFGQVLAASAGTNVRVTLDQSGTYQSADQLTVGPTGYTDAVLARCGTDRRQQNEPSLAIDPRDSDVWVSGSNDGCTVPTTGDGWAGFYRSTNAGATWTDSLLPAYKGDTSTQGTSSPLAAFVAGGALAAGDPFQAWDADGRLFYIGNNFSRGIENGFSGLTRNNIGNIWVATYGPVDPSNHSTDGANYLRTVILATNVFGFGSLNDKTDIAVDQSNGNVYAAWSDFKAFGCNQIMFSRSIDHGQTFSVPLKLSSGICGNQGPSIAVDAAGHVNITWIGVTGGAAQVAPTTVAGAAFAVSTDDGVSFSNARVVLTYDPFIGEAFSGNGARDCGDAPLDCPTGFTFPRFDLADPYLAAVHTTNGDSLVMAFQARQSSGQGQIEYSYSTNGGDSWSTPALLDPSPNDGHQFYNFLAASAGRVSAIWYDSRGDLDYAATRPPCNDADGVVSACLNVRYAESADGGVTWSSSIQVTDAATNPNYEQFGARHVPFFGDYITVAAVGNVVGAAWTDSRNTVGAADASGDDDGADVAGDPEAGGTCTESVTTCFDLTGGLDQNIYAAPITP